MMLLKVVCSLIVWILLSIVMAEVTSGPQERCYIPSPIQEFLEMVRQRQYREAAVDLLVTIVLGSFYSLPLMVMYWLSLTQPR